MKSNSPALARPYAGHEYTCVTCEMAIDGKPTFHLGLAFCCPGCAVSGPCVCSYDDRPTSNFRLTGDARATTIPVHEPKVAATPDLTPAREPERELALSRS